jgi:hypothetical protein
MARTKKKPVMVHTSRTTDKVVDSAIGEGLADLRAGRVTPKFSSVEEFRAYCKQHLFMNHLLER